MTFTQNTAAFLLFQNLERPRPLIAPPPCLLPLIDMLFSVFAFTADPWDNHGRHSPLRMHFHSAIFRSELNLVVAHLLHVRVPFPSFRHPHHHLLGDDDTTVLLSLMRRGKSTCFDHCYCTCQNTRFRQLELVI